MAIEIVSNYKQTEQTWAFKFTDTEIQCSSWSSSMLCTTLWIC